MYKPRHQEVTKLLVGAYDLHTHPAPDVIPRSVDDSTLVRIASEAGMAGVLLKNHHEPTAARAILANAGGNSTKAYGAIVLNASVGGLNPYAVETSLKMGARIVWMPTVDARNQKVYSRAFSGAGSDMGIYLLSETGELLPEVYDILHLIKEHGATVATGHISMPETVALIEATVQLGVRSVLTHPDWDCTTLPIALQKELAGKGAMVEKLWLEIGRNLITAAYIAATIRELGAEHVYMATDRGQAGAEMPTEAMMMFMDAMLDCGLTYNEICTMTHENPAAILAP